MTIRCLAVRMGGGMHAIKGGEAIRNFEATVGKSTAQAYFQLLDVVACSPTHQDIFVVIVERAHGGDFSTDLSLAETNTDPKSISLRA